MNSTNKGKVGERQFAQFLRSEGFTARRGQQHSGNPDSPDVVSDLPYHIEVKRTERLRMSDACAQAQGDCGGKPWIVAHRSNNAPWLVTMRADEFLRLVRETINPEPMKGGDAK